MLPDKEKIKVMLIDDQPAILRGLEELVANTGIAEVVATATDGQEAIPKALELRPDIITVDVSMPGMTGIEIARKIKQQWSDVRMTAISAYANELYVRSMLEAGVQGYLLKDNAPEEIKEAFETILAGKVWLGKGLTIPKGESPAV